MKLTILSPLVSAKPKHEKLHEGYTLIKIKKNNKLLSVLSLNNMIPVPKECVIQFNIDQIEDSKYRNLLKNEFLACRAKKSMILRNAKSLHKSMTTEPEKHKKLISFCVDFNKLEKFAKEYSNLKRPQNKFEERIEQVNKQRQNTDTQEKNKTR
ncbi:MULTISPECIES: type III toxin-antitoxin system ToxN/AbiQ family toxin [unclassified Lactococcus]|uniref:type III toxin-antitoxin system ToxN/AbiQ family toxin n=1 Tax=unclassified Lactococcus TaxID=2643510 RepID=UPI0011CA69EB|nr:MULTISPECIES: type III toxin-antitoxin system ToxN/AbiQ family toxin [unclassified Lactococcus]MQW24060.1 type III toxin-antitoxin system ToxN/AbiQ family toxin [Lactococcus sp. dk101]TXK36497.1 type III toxin-antitoxin system ToxN/AbiQ family toxin [Lactococcus sp. dk310]TXK47168.1 type III toxin-antitoxin system ToxN/AbiQ family toxin [Lactococcus sp. dk322]